MSDQNFEWRYLENDKSFFKNLKTGFHHFERSFIVEIIIFYAGIPLRKTDLNYICDVNDIARQHKILVCNIALKTKPRQPVHNIPPRRHTWKLRIDENGILAAADETCGKTRRGMPRPKETWWWNVPSQRRDAHGSNGKMEGRKKTILLPREQPEQQYTSLNGMHKLRSLMPSTAMMTKIAFSRWHANSGVRTWILLVKRSCTKRRGQAESLAVTLWQAVKWRVSMEQWISKWWTCHWRSSHPCHWGNGFKSHHGNEGRKSYWILWYHHRDD